MDNIYDILKHLFPFAGYSIAFCLGPLVFIIIAPLFDIKIEWSLKNQNMGRKKQDPEAYLLSILPVRYKRKLPSFEIRFYRNNLILIRTFLIHKKGAHSSQPHLKAGGYYYYEYNIDENRFPISNYHKKFMLADQRNIGRLIKFEE